MSTLCVTGIFRRSAVVVACCVFGAASAPAQQAQLPQDIFGQLAIGVNTRIGNRFGSDLSGSIEGMVGTHRAFRSWYRPSAVSGGVTRLFASRCQSRGIGDCLQPAQAVPWLTVMTGGSRALRFGTLRVMGGPGAAYARGELDNAQSLVLAFEARADLLLFPTPRLGATLFLRSLTVAGQGASQANGFALGIGIARRQAPVSLFARDQ